MLIVLVCIQFKRIRIQIPSRNPFHPFESAFRGFHRTVLIPRLANINNPLDASMPVSSVVA
jgi:hypothetical protein